MKCQMIIFVCLLLSFAVCPIAAQGIPEISVPMIGRSPVIDGSIDSGEWSNAATIPVFVDYMTSADSIKRKTICRVMQGADAFYVAFRCFDPEPEKLVMDVIEREGAVWTNDSVDVFLDPAGDRKSYFHFVVNPAGAQYDECGKIGSWDTFWTARTSVAKDSWQVEMAIPYSSLGISSSKPASNDWAANFCRVYPARTGAEQELSCWSATRGGFHAPERFGTLRGMCGNASPLTLDPQITLKTPAKWLVGANPLKVSVRSHASPKKSTAVEMKCIDSANGRLISRTNLRIGTKPGCVINHSIHLNEGTHQRQFIVVDKENRLLASSQIIHARTAALNCKLIAPAFRGNVQSKDPEKLIWVKGSTGVAGRGWMRVRASLVSSGSDAIWVKKISVRPAGSFEFKQDASDLPVGDYTLKVALADGKGSPVSTKLFPVKVLAPVVHEVTFDSRRVCHVNGKPFFPIGIYHVSRLALSRLNPRAQELGLPVLDMESVLRDVREHGFNLVHTGWGMPDEEYLRMASEAGLYVFPEVYGPTIRELGQLKATADKWGNIPIWYGYDEPAGERLQMALAARARYLQGDPHRPVSAAICEPAVFEAGTKAFDILMMDPYFIRFAPLSKIGDWIDRGMRIAEYSKPIWVVPQAFAVDLNNVWSEPTCEELRCEAYISLVHGATGLIWYAYYDTTEPWSKNQKGRRQWYIPDTPLWPYFKTLNAEISEIVPVITQGKRIGRVSWRSRQIHACLWEYDGDRYIIAVNPSDKPVTCSLSGVRTKSVDVLFENRRVGIEADVLADAFKPLEAHIYKYRIR